jgi:hypothetical protein
MRQAWLRDGIVIIIVWAALMVSLGYCARVRAHDHARPELDKWFNELRSRMGPCCSNNDGNAVLETDWATTKDGKHYRVLIDGEWYNVPDEAVIKEPNLDGRTMVWPYYINGKPIIRCFMPGSMT